MQPVHTSRWPVIIVWLYFLLFPLSLLQSIVANPTATAAIYAMKGVLVLWGFFYIFMFRKKVTLPALGLVGFGVSLMLNIVTVNKFSIDIWALYLLSFLVYNLSASEQRKLIRYSGWTYFLTPFILVAGTALGLIRSDMWFSDEGLQFSFGLSNPNYFMFFFLYACFCWMLLEKKLLLFLSFAAAVVFYYVTETRSVLYSGFYLLAMTFIFSILRKMRLQLIFRMIGWTIVLLINLSLVLMLMGYYDILEMIAFSDSNLRSRVIDVLEINEFLKSNPDVLLFGGFEARLDNMYLNLICGLGIIHFIVLWLLMQYALIQSINTNRFERFILVSCMLLIGFIEHGLYSTILPSVLLFVFITSSRNIVFKNHRHAEPMPAVNL